MARDNGGIIGPVNDPTNTSASGVWSLEEQYQAQLAGNWPSAPAEFSTNSLRFDDGSSDYLNRTPASAGNRKTYTFSAWVKRSKLADLQTIFGAYSSSRDTFRFNNGDTITFLTNDASNAVLTTNAVYRDVSAWYHLVLAVDTSQGTASNRVKIYVNGEQVTSFSTETYPSLNDEQNINNNVLHTIGRRPSSAVDYYGGYMSEVIFVDGQQLDATSFGVSDANGVWTPIKYTGTFGTNGFQLQFGNSAALGTDSSPNGNDFTVNNLTSIDQTTDYPVNNFATLNPLIPDGSITLAEGNLKVASIGDNDWRAGTFGGSFKWYAECKINVAYDGSGGGICIGAISEDGLTENNGGTFGMSFANAKWYTNSNDGKFQQGNGTDVTTGLTRASTNDIVGVACDSANGRIYIHVNGTYLNSGDPVGGTGFIGGTTGYQGAWFPFSGSHLDKGQGSWNFGNAPYTISSGNSDANGYGNFEYAVPSGYYALCTKNLAEYG